MKKPAALNLIKQLVIETLDLDVDLQCDEIGRKMTNAFDFGYRGGMSAREIEAFILVTTNREVFRRTGRLI